MDQLGYMLIVCKERRRKETLFFFEEIKLRENDVIRKSMSRSRFRRKSKEEITQNIKEKEKKGLSAERFAIGIKYL